MKFQLTIQYFSVMFVARLVTNEAYRVPPRTSDVTHYYQDKPTKDRLFHQIYSKKSPFEYLKTPNFDVLLLKENKFDPAWKRYSQLFEPKDLTDVPQIEVRNSVPTSSFLKPLMNLNAAGVDPVLGGRKLIMVLQPRNCRPFSKMRGVRRPSLDEFENKFLPKILQHLNEYPTKRLKRTNTVDPVIDQILKILDKDEQEALDDIKSAIQGYSHYPKYSREKFTENRPKPYIMDKTTSSKKPCNEEFVFYVQPQKSSTSPNSFNEILLRVLKVITDIN